MQTVTEPMWDQLWLPIYPLVSDDLRHGIYRQVRDEALNRRYIEANPNAISNLLVVDVDKPDSVLRSVSTAAGAGHPMPTAIVENPTNGHCHSVWALAQPITRTEYGRRKPLAYAAAVVEGLRAALEGDRGYSGLMTKNPLNGAWIAHWMHDELYTLDELTWHLGDNMPGPNWRRTKRAHQVGLGRNCTLFNAVSVWVRRELRHWFGNPAGLGAAIEAECAVRNAEFPEPLQAAEVLCIARSITRWVLTKSRMWADGPAVYEATFSTMQSARGKHSVAARQRNTNRKLESLFGSN